MKRIGIVAALPSELRPLIHHWPRNGHMATGRIGSLDAVATCEGMGAPPSPAPANVLLASGPLDALVSVGYAGSLSCGLSAPEAYAVREVIDAATGEGFPTDPPAATGPAKGQRLITLDHVAGPRRKAQPRHKLPGRHGRYGSRHRRPLRSRQGLAFLCFKGHHRRPQRQAPRFQPLHRPRRPAPHPRLRSLDPLASSILAGP